LKLLLSFKASKTFWYPEQNFHRGFYLGKIMGGIIFVILGATFCVLNRQEISLRYFFGWNTEPFPLFLLILGSLAGGMVAGFLVGWGGRRNLRAEVHDLEKQAQALREEIATLTPKEEGPEPPSKETEISSPPLS
jgi:uncharacterized integral membrane protein